MNKIDSSKLIELLNSIRELKKGIIVYLKKEEQDEGKIKKINNWDMDIDNYQEDDNEDKKVRAIKVDVILSNLKSYNDESLLISLFSGITLISDDDTLEELILIEEKDIIAVLNK